MTPSRTWLSANGSIIRCLTAMRLIHLSDLMDMGPPGFKVHGSRFSVRRSRLRIGTSHPGTAAITAYVEPQHSGTAAPSPDKEPRRGQTETPPLTSLSALQNMRLIHSVRPSVAAVPT